MRVDVLLEKVMALFGGLFGFLPYLIYIGIFVGLATLLGGGTIPTV